MKVIIQLSDFLSLERVFKTNQLPPLPSGVWKPQPLLCTVRRPEDTFRTMSPAGQPRQHTLVCRWTRLYFVSLEVIGITEELGLTCRDMRKSRSTFVMASFHKYITTEGKWWIIENNGLLSPVWTWSLTTSGSRGTSLSSSRTESSE